MSGMCPEFTQARELVSPALRDRLIALRRDLHEQQSARAGCDRDAGEEETDRGRHQRRDTGAQSKPQADRADAQPGVERALRKPNDHRDEHHQTQPQPNRLRSRTLQQQALKYP